MLQIEEPYLRSPHFRVRVMLGVSGLHLGVAITGGDARDDEVVSRMGHGDWGCRWSLSSITSLSFVPMLVATLLAPALAQAAAGDLDRSFSGNGKVTTDFGRDERPFA